MTNTIKCYLRFASPYRRSSPLLHTADCRSATASTAESYEKEQRLLFIDFKAACRRHRVVLAAALTTDFVVVFLERRVTREEKAAASVWRSLQTSSIKSCGPRREAAFSALGCIVSEKLYECH